MKASWRALRALALLAFAGSGCEMVAGLSGDREQLALGGASGCAENGGDDNGCSSGGSSGFPGGAGSGGELVTAAGSAGAEPEMGGMSGAAGSTQFDGGVGCDAGVNPSVAGQSCDEATQCNDESACTTLCLPGGAFPMGRGDAEDAYPGAAQEQPEHSVTVSRFWLDKYEVTVGRFRRFVESYDGHKPPSGAGAHPNVPSSGWKSEWNDYLPSDRAALEATLIATGPDCAAPFRTWTSAPSNSECLPINCVNWYVSFAFCLWDGGRLPSEAEWEYAAAGGDQNRLYPWGADAPDNSRAVLNCTASGNTDCSTADVRDVGSKPLGNGRWFHADLAGSMAEPTRDVFERDFYAAVKKGASDLINLAFDATQGTTTVRGGAFWSTDADARSAYRTGVARSARADDVGIRCARNP